MIQLTTKQKITLTFAALLFIFIGPMIAAWSLYTSRAPLLETANYGQLLSPPLSLAALSLQDTDGTVFPMQALQGRWLLLYINPGQCGKSCFQTLYMMRQARLALGKEQTRVQRMLVTYLQPTPDVVLDRQLEQAYAGTFHAIVTPDNLQRWDAKITQSAGALFIADPLGNVMLQYVPAQNPQDVLKDLNRLLKISQIG